ncbi:hypothetical protein L0Y41_02255 [bacterium]|nr:hypothetical protein [bacterium]
MKTNKSFTKRIRVTKKGKLLARKGGGNHFNAKERRVNQLERRHPERLSFSGKTKSRFLPSS